MVAPILHPARLSVAPMMDWTDRHCRYFHRQMTRHALLYTEMVTAPALVRGGALHLLEYSSEEQPVALQLGGSDPAELAQAARLGAEHGFNEINLNIGCPSDRVQSGCFGAVLMREPGRVAACVQAMQDAVSADVTVKCRIGVDDQDPKSALPQFLDAMQDVGVRRVIVHARKAWLDGLSPAQNREIPPLDYDLVADQARARPDLSLILNGGIGSLSAAREHLEGPFAGIMIGRAAYQTPSDLLLPVDWIIFDETGAERTAEEAVIAMRDYVECHVTDGGKLSAITRHMLGAFAGRPGARKWRRHLSENAHRPGAGWSVVTDALALVNDLDAAA